MKKIQHIINELLLTCQKNGLTYNHHIDVLKSYSKDYNFSVSQRVAFNYGSLELELAQTFYYCKNYLKEDEFLKFTDEISTSAPWLFFTEALYNVYLEKNLDILSETLTLPTNDVFQKIIDKYRLGTGNHIHDYLLRINTVSLDTHKNFHASIIDEVVTCSLKIINMLIELQGTTQHISVHPVMQSIRSDIIDVFGEKNYIERDLTRRIDILLKNNTVSLNIAKHILDNKEFFYLDVFNLFPYPTQTMFTKLMAKHLLSAKDKLNDTEYYSFIAHIDKIAPYLFFKDRLYTVQLEQMTDGHDFFNDSLSAAHFSSVYDIHNVGTGNVICDWLMRAPTNTLDRITEHLNNLLDESFDCMLNIIDYLNGNFVGPNNFKQPDNVNDWDRIILRGDGSLIENLLKYDLKNRLDILRKNNNLLIKIAQHSVDNNESKYLDYILTDLDLEKQDLILHEFIVYKTAFLKLNNVDEIEIKKEILKSAREININIHAKSPNNTALDIDILPNIKTFVVSCFTFGSFVRINNNPVGEESILEWLNLPNNSDGNNKFSHVLDSLSNAEEKVKPIKRNKLNP